MRKIIYHTFWTLLILATFFYWLEPLSIYNRFSEKRALQDTPYADARSSIAYLLPQQSWMTFSIPSFSSSIKLLSTANFFPSSLNVMQSVEDSLYSIEYEILDKRNNVLESKIYHHRTSIELFKDKNGKPSLRSFYKDSALIPSYTEMLFVHLKKYPEAIKLRIRLHEKDDNIADISIRGYRFEKSSEHRAKLSWERMYLDKKSFLARANVYDVPYLLDSEKLNLLSSSWRQMGPLGVADRDYVERRLFITDDQDQLNRYKNETPLIYADANLSATRYLPSGSYKIEASTLSDGVQATIMLRQYIGKNSSAYDEQSFSSQTKGFIYTLEQGGIVEINSTRPVSLQITDMKTQTVLHLPAKFSSYYNLEGDKTLEYKFYTYKKRYLRVECRKSDPQDLSINIQMINTRGSLVKNLSSIISSEISRYDYTDDFTPLSNAQYIYLELPADIKSLKFSSKKPLMIRLASRNVSTPYPLYSFSSYTKPDFEYFSAWFTLRPDGFNSSSVEEKKRLIFKQVRPPQVNDFVKEGQYKYEHLYPRGVWKGHEILFPRKNAQNYIRPQSRNSLYSELSINKMNTLHFENDIGLRFASPHLLYYQKDPSAKEIVVFINDVEVARPTLYSTSGRIALPNVLVKKEQNLHFEHTSSGEFFISYAPAQGSPVHQKRLFFSLEKGMHFSFNKSSDNESIGFQFALPSTEEKTLLESQVRLDYRPKSSLLLDSLSFKNYTLHADVSVQKARGITQGDKSFLLSDPFYLSLAKNIPNGMHTLSIYPPQGVKESYLFINHLKLNTQANTRLSKERL